MNPNPYQARLAKALRSKPGDLKALMKRDWAVLCIAYEDVGAADDVEQRRKAILAYSQASGNYRQSWQAYELEARVQALEASMRLPVTRNGQDG
jgi:hypothetical protein